MSVKVISNLKVKLLGHSKSSHIVMQHSARNRPPRVFASLRGSANLSTVIVSPPWVRFGLPSEPSPLCGCLELCPVPFTTPACSSPCCSNCRPNTAFFSGDREHQRRIRSQNISPFFQHKIVTAGFPTHLKCANGPPSTQRNTVTLRRKSTKRQNRKRDRLPNFNMCSN